MTNDELTEDERRLLDDFGREFATLEALQPVALELTRTQAFFLLSQLQLALRHPGNVGPASEFAKHIARQLEEAVSVSPALCEMARRGWAITH